MLKNKFITKDEYDDALAEKITFLPQESTGIKAPHFVMKVKSELEQKYGVKVMQSGGFKVITTLDYDLQSKAEEIAKRYALENEENYNASNAAITAVDVTNGDVLVMVGSRDYFDQNIDGNYNIATALRQPGSSFKPFVYATAFNKGYTPDTVLFDLPTQFSTECKPDGTPIIAGNEDKCYSPVNYDGKFRGPIKLRDALAQSINVPSIEVLYLAGIRDSIDLATNMGITSLADPDRYGLTLVLGGGEVSLLDMTGAYAVFANDGVKVPPNDILKIEDGNGKMIYSYTSEQKSVLDPNVARKITDILSDNGARSPSYGYSSPLYFPGYDVAAKTGTTNDYRDAWIIGYSPRIAVGAWAGNNDNTPMEKRVAGFIVAPMWNVFMQEVLKSEPVSYFKKPNEEPDLNLKPVLRGIWQGGESYFIDTRTGQSASPSTPEAYKQEKVVPSVHSILYWVNKGNPMGPRPDYPGTDSQFNLWEVPIQKWVVENNINATLETVKAKSSSTETPQVEQIKPLGVTFLSPIQGTPYPATGKITISLSITGKYPPIKAEFYVNGESIGEAANAPFSISFMPKEVSSVQKYNNAKVVVYSSAGERVEARTSFVVNF